MEWNSGYPGTEVVTLLGGGMDGEEDLCNMFFKGFCFQIPDDRECVPPALPTPNVVSEPVHMIES